MVCVCVSAGWGQADRQQCVIRGFTTMYYYVTISLLICEAGCSRSPNSRVQSCGFGDLVSKLLESCSDVAHNPML